MTKPICKIDGCGKSVRSLGYCNSHYLKNHKYGDPLWKPEPRPTTCEIDGCEKGIFCRTYCSTHYSRFQAHGNPLYEPKVYAEFCSIEGCEKPRSAKGFCKLHYERNRVHGSPHHFARKTKFGEPLEFLHKAAKSNESECIEWPYKIMAAGYGVLRYKGREARAHRLCLIFAKGEPPTEKHVAAHAPIMCHNRACVNPNHLRWATVAENNADMILDGTSRRRDKIAQAQGRT